MFDDENLASGQGPPHTIFKATQVGAASFPEIDDNVEWPWNEGGDEEENDEMMEMVQMVDEGEDMWRCFVCVREKDHNHVRHVDDHKMMVMWDGDEGLWMTTNTDNDDIVRLQEPWSTKVAFGGTEKTQEVPLKWRSHPNSNRNSADISFDSWVGCLTFSGSPVFQPSNNDIVL